MKLILAFEVSHWDYPKLAPKIEEWTRRCADAGYEVHEHHSPMLDMVSFKVFGDPTKKPATEAGLKLVGAELTVPV